MLATNSICHKYFVSQIKQVFGLNPICGPSILLPLI